MAGKAVMCDGTTYQIDATGVANVTNADHARKLLTMSAWRACSGDESGPQKAPEKLPMPVPKAEAPGKPVEEPQEAGKDSQGEAADPTKGNAGFATQEEADAAKAAGPMKAVDPAGVPPPAADVPEGEGSTAWPDPEMTMNKSYLQEMATAYEVKFEDKTTKQQLVDDILKKMYDQ